MPAGWPGSVPEGSYSFWNANLAMQLGVGLLHRGELDEGLASFARGRDLYLSLGIRTALATFSASVALALLGHGRTDEAAGHVADARLELDTYGQGWPEPLVLLAEAELAAARGAPTDEVAARFARAEAVARAQGSTAIAERISSAAAARR